MTPTSQQLTNQNYDLLSSIRQYCDQIELKDKDYHVFVEGSYSRDSVMEQAKDLLKQYPDPSSRPALFGIPIGIKDIIHATGFVTRCGTQLPSHLFQGQEASCVTRLKKAGAIIRRLFNPENPIF
ncbi:MAG: hypothetical protein COB67_02740 [SAR324 cluster bacterium]|uniref:Amidase domain-containing protein n=1 Tax=SAR324 cluster bacterium TaxID=2024889 RepID=A0A2A4TAL0_9DELT|nr:MAG: hypothetical protein COB67_02740 [SAR324 cluster bacterium]